MDLVYFEDKSDIKQEEKENLKANILKIEKIIEERKRIQDNYRDERDNYRNDYANAEYFIQCNRIIGELEDEIKNLKIIEESPYFGRLNLNDDSGNMWDLYVGDKAIRDTLNNELVYDWRAPVASMFYSNQTSLKYNDYNYDLIFKRRLLIEKKELLDCEELFNSEDEDSAVNDYFLKKIIRSRKNQEGFSDIIKTIQSKQNSIIRADLGTNMICQGVAGSGKTVIIVHRISYLLYNNPNIDANSFLYIAPNDNFKNELNELNKRLEIDEITLKTINEYYLYKLNEYINIDNTEKVYFRDVEGDIEKNDSFDEEIIYKKFECVKKTYREILKKYEGIFDYKYDDSILPAENGRLLYKHIINSMNKDKEKTSIRNNIKELTKYLELQHISISNNTLPNNYRELFNKNVDNKIDERSLIVEQMKKGKSDEKISEKIVQDIDIEISNVENQINEINQKISNHSFISKIFRRDQLKELHEELNFLNDKNESLKRQKEVELARIQKGLKKDEYIKEIEEYEKIKQFGNDVFDLDSILDNLKIYFFDTKERDLFKIFLKKLMIQLLIDENQIKYRDKISQGILEIKKSLENIKMKEEQKIENFAANLRKEINPRNIVGIIFSELFERDFSGNQTLTRYQAFLTLKILNMFGIKRNENYRYVYVDEAQDYGDLEILLIKQIEDSTMNIFGDINQNVKGEWFKRKSWDSLKDYIGLDTKCYELNENYRNTINVVEYCNKNLKTNMMGIGVNGNDVVVSAFNNISEVIEKAQEENAVIITNNEKYLEAIKKSSDVRCFSVKEAKGLEFRNVVVIDEKLDQNSKYIAYTRSLNNLVVYKKK